MITDDELRQYIAITTGKPETARLTQDEAAIFMQVHSAFAAELAAELLQRRESDRWVPVSERLPEMGVLVLADIGSGRSIVAYLHADDKHTSTENIWAEPIQNITLIGTDRVRRWQHIPQPPEVA
jgi:hypothetical protein